ncbi:hypothetical protein DdX_05130 [Ditylenchus destructor]|uniref:Uncharacterized protein n=1 Tax=Ditylenchus destructor TaxID=166010 RepID=A0AAD4RAM7_9BILA|nr:hypothetical protein DdX_05130 [Ditylenchus destructor]
MSSKFSVCLLVVLAVIICTSLLSTVEAQWGYGMYGYRPWGMGYGGWGMRPWGMGYGFRPYGMYGWGKK